MELKNERAIPTPFIFLADDDDDDVFLFQTALNESGIDHTLQVAKDGMQLLESLDGSEATDPDIVFLDINMPRRNGFECLRKLRSYCSQKLPIFILSTSQDPDAVEKARELGATGFLSKPNSIPSLSKLLKDVISKDWKSRGQSSFYLHVQYDCIDAIVSQR